ncbi:MAG: response regulator transcription factor [Anaerolineaceae bacterium]|nr:response regulator transcription factor [Anaerolineaceae bacterium]
MVKAPEVRFVISDGQAVVRAGLIAYLSADERFVVTGEAATGEEAVRLCELVAPDFVLMDLDMPVMNGFNAARIIRKNWPYIRVIVISSSFGNGDVQGAFQAGAIAYLTKNLDSQELIHAIEQAMVGKPTLAPEAMQALINLNTKQAEIHYKLTERQQDVLDLIVEGLSNSEIANQLVISQSTVKYHVSRILSKMGANTRTEAVSIAMKNNFPKWQTN